MRIQHQNEIDRQSLVSFLLKGICQVSFIKVKDGSNRVIYCTLNYGFIPKNFETSIDKTISGSGFDPDIIPIWDVMEQKWKSFRLSKMNLFVTSDELVEENKNKPTTHNELITTLNKRKQDVYGKFRERVERLKEEAKQAKNNINGVNNENKA